MSWAVVYGVSGNPRRFWDLTHACDLLGWEPAEDYACAAAVVAELVAPDLPRRRQRQLVDELDLARDFGARRSRTRAFSSAASLSEDDVATTKALIASPRTSSGIPITAASDTAGWRTRHSSPRADPVAGARDQVVGAADEAVVLPVDLGEIARVQPAVSHLLGRRFRVVPVTEEGDRVAVGADRHLSVGETQS